MIDINIDNTRFCYFSSPGRPGEGSRLLVTAAWLPIGDNQIAVSITRCSSEETNGTKTRGRDIAKGRLNAYLTENKNHQTIRVMTREQLKERIVRSRQLSQKAPNTARKKIAQAFLRPA
jgi:hypothetical protein